MTNKFKFENIGDIISPRDLIEAGLFKGSKMAIYALFNTEGFPMFKIGHKKFVTKENLVKWFNSNIAM